MRLFILPIFILSILSVAGLDVANTRIHLNDTLPSMLKLTMDWNCRSKSFFLLKGTGIKLWFL